MPVIAVSTRRFNSANIAYPLTAQGVGRVTAATAAAASDPTSRPIRLARFVYADDPAPTSPTATRYEWHGMQGNHTADRLRIKTANPAAECLVYANPTVTRPSDPTGITGAYPASSFPNAWLLRDAGNNIMLRNVGPYSGTDWKMIDFTNTSFQSAAITFLSNKCANDGWDGVLLDDILPYNQFNTSYPTAIPNESAWVTAMSTSIKNIANGIKANGFSVYGNVADQYHLDFWLDISGVLTGGSQEGWISVDNGSIVDTLQNGRWTASLAQAAQAEAQQRGHVYHVSTSTAAVARYALCSLLLVWEGYSRISFAPDQDGDDVHFAELDQVAALGQPSGSIVVDSTGVRRRAFAGGTVTVNPNDTAKTAFSATWPAQSGTLTVAAGGSSSVAFDAVGPSAAGEGAQDASTLTWSHTCTGANRLLLVDVAVGAGVTSSITTTATYGGVAMTSVGRIESNNATAGYIQRFRLTAPAVGTASVVVTASTGVSALAGGSMSFTGVHQTTPLGTPVTAFGSSATPNVTVTGTTSGNVIAAAACCGAGFAGSGNTSRWQRNINTNTAAGNGAASTAAAGGSVTMSFTSGDDWWSAIASEIRAA